MYFNYITCRAGEGGNDRDVAARKRVEQRRFARVGRPGDDHDRALAQPFPGARGCKLGFQPGKNGGEDLARAPPGKPRHALFLREIDLGFEERRRLQERAPPDRGLTPEHTLSLTKGGAALPFGFRVDEIGEPFDLRQIHLAVDQRAASELPWFGRAGALDAADGLDHAGNDGAAAMDMEFGIVLTRISF